MTQPHSASLPVIVVGAGPIGLAAAAHLVEQGLEPVVLEQEALASATVRAWGHVRLFSPWRELVDPAAARLLRGTGWTAPEGAEYPTGSRSGATATQRPARRHTPARSPTASPTSPHRKNALGMPAG